jgi:hypothetical protein
MTFYYNGNIYSKGKLSCCAATSSINESKMEMDENDIYETSLSNNAWYRMWQGKTKEKKISGA